MNITFITLLSILFLLFAVLAWRNLKMALILLSGLLPIYLLRLEVGPIPSTALEFLILICAIIFFTKLIVPSPQSPTPTLGGASRLIEYRKWLSPTILLVASACFGVLVAPDTFSALGIWKAYFIEPIIVAIMMLTVFSKNDWHRCVRAISISGIVISIFAIFQYLTGIGIPAPWDIELRATSVFDYPNALGLFLAPIVSLNIISSFLRKQESIECKITSILTITIGLIAITLSQTEAALVAIPVAVMLTLFVSNISKHKKLITLAVFALITAIALIIPQTREKILLQDYSGQVRLSQWSETLELLKDHPFFGAGLNSYPTVLAPYHDSTLYEIFQYPHNIFLNIWVELGILGLISFFWLGFLTIKAVISNMLAIPRSVSDEGPTRADYSPAFGVVRMTDLRLALFCALLTMFIHGLVDVPYFKNDLAILTWVFLIAFIAFSTKTTGVCSRITL